MNILLKFFAFAYSVIVVLIAGYLAVVLGVFATDAPSTPEVFGIFFGLVFFVVVVGIFVGLPYWVIKRFKTQKSFSSLFEYPLF